MDTDIPYFGVASKKMLGMRNSTINKFACCHFVEKCDVSTKIVTFSTKLVFISTKKDRANLLIVDFLFGKARLSLRLPSEPSIVALLTSRGRFGPRLSIERLPLLDVLSQKKPDLLCCTDRSN